MFINFIFPKKVDDLKEEEKDETAPLIAANEEISYLSLLKHSRFTFAAISGTLNYFL